MTKTSAKFDIYEFINNEIITQLENGIIPWLKPWTGRADGAYSRATGKPYSLLNQFLLGGSGEWATFKQITESGGKIKKGEKARQVVYWSQVKITEKDDNGKPLTDNSGKPVEKIVPMLKYYSVFRVGVQTEGIEPLEEAPSAPIITESEDDAVGYIKTYCHDYNIKLEHLFQDRAYYSPASDRISLPMREQFTNSAEYLGTLYHEAIHSTGHKSRLDRLSTVAHFGNEEYSREELVAEIGAASALRQLGVDTAASLKNSAAYIQSWLRALKNDKKMIVWAASRAEKAVNMIFDASIIPQI